MLTSVANPRHKSSQRSPSVPLQPRAIGTPFPVPHQEDDAMSTPIRCGKAAVFTFDHDALEILPLLAPSKKAQGRFLSELIRQEVVRREERQKVLGALAA